LIDLSEENLVNQQDEQHSTNVCDDGSLPESRFIGFYATRDEMVSRCLPHRQLWVSNLS